MSGNEHPRLGHVSDSMVQPASSLAESLDTLSDSSWLVLVDMVRFLVLRLSRPTKAAPAGFLLAYSIIHSRVLNPRPVLIEPPRLDCRGPSTHGGATTTATNTHRTTTTMCSNVERRRKDAGSMSLLDFFRPRTPQGLKAAAVEADDRAIGLAAQQQVGPTTQARDRERDSEDEQAAVREDDEVSAPTPEGPSAPRARPNWGNGFMRRLGTPVHSYSRKGRRKRPRVCEDFVADPVPPNGEDGLPSASAAPSGDGEADGIKAEGAIATACEQPAPAPTRMRQLYLDLGQSNFAHTRCEVCGLVYAVGEPEDEKTHRDYHRRHVVAKQARAEQGH